MQIRLDNGFMLFALRGVFATIRDNRTQGLHVEAIGFRFFEDVTLVVIEFGDVSLKFLDARDIRLEHVSGEACFRHRSPPT